MTLNLAGQIIVHFIQENAVILVSSLLVVNLLVLILVLINARSKEKVYKRYSSLIAGFEEQNLDLMLRELRDKLYLMESKLNELENVNESLRKSFSFAVQHVGVVRYNAFSNMGSDLSFSVALLDKKGNGVVITSIYGRDESRIFAKPIKGQESTYPLTEEEKEAIQKAIRQVG